MRKILKWEEYEKSAKVWEDFAKLLVDSNIRESKDENIEKAREIINRFL